MAFAGVQSSAWHILWTHPLVFDHATSMQEGPTGAFTGPTEP